MICYFRSNVSNRESKSDSSLYKFKVDDGFFDDSSEIYINRFSDPEESMFNNSTPNLPSHQFKKVNSSRGNTFL